MVESWLKGGSMGRNCFFSASIAVRSEYLMPASTLTVRSR